MTNFEVLQEYEKVGVPLPRLEEVEQIKELLQECQSVFEEIKKDRGVYFNNIHLTELIDEIDGVLK